MNTGFLINAIRHVKRAPFRWVKIWHSGGGNMFRLAFCVILALALYPVEAGAVYCKSAGVPKGCVARPAHGAGAARGAGAGARGVGAAPGAGVGSPGAGASPGAGTVNGGGPVNRSGVR